MITLLAGENSFELERALGAIVEGFDGAVERVDGSDLELKRLPDLLMGGTLFSEHRLIIIRALSDNKALWPVLSDWLPRVSDDVHLVLIEPKPDKRTKTYKDMQKLATVQEFKLWGERDTSLAERWVSDEATRLGFSLEAKNARLLVARVGIDQWQLYRALEKLAVLDVVDEVIIKDVIEQNPAENVFNLFEAALRGDTRLVHQMIKTLELTEDVYRVFGLLSGQAFQVQALTLADKPSGEVAKDIGAHPYAVSKLVSYAKKLDKVGGRQVVAAFAEADAGMKISLADPWLLIERALLRVAALRT